MLLRSFIVIREYGKEPLRGLLIEKNTRPCLIEIKGYKPLVLTTEGKKIDKGDKIAYVITNKGEVRVIRSPCSGVVVLVINLPWEKPEKYILVVVGENEYRQIIIRKNS